MADAEKSNQLETVLVAKNRQKLEAKPEIPIRRAGRSDEDFTKEQIEIVNKFRPLVSVTLAAQEAVKKNLLLKSTGMDTTSKK